MAGSLLWVRITVLSYILLMTMLYSKGVAAEQGWRTSRRSQGRSKGHMSGSDVVSVEVQEGHLGVEEGWSRVETRSKPGTRAA